MQTNGGREKPTDISVLVAVEHGATKGAETFQVRAVRQGQRRVLQLGERPLPRGGALRPQHCLRRRWWNRPLSRDRPRLRVVTQEQAEAVPN